MRGGPPAPERPLRLAVVTNIPAPYRVPVYNRLAREDGIDLHAFYAARSEPDRAWDLPPIEHAHTFLPGTVHQRGGRYIHHNPGTWKALRRFDPDVVVTTGYNPTHLAAWAYALTHRRGHVVMTDGTDASEARLGLAHRTVRRAVFAGTRAFVVAAEGGWRLLHAYGVPDVLIHTSPLCANTAVSWAPAPGAVRDIDLLFSGRLVEVKNAGFALQVAQGAAHRLGRRLKMAVLGKGPLEAALRSQASALADEVDVTFAGHVAQADMPRWFGHARVFLFPTRWDPWGVVANEACLAGVPVLVSPHAGVAGELVRDGVDGRVLPLQLPLWIDATAALLADGALRERWGAAAAAIVEPYNFDNAALGMADAARHAWTPANPPPRRSRFRRPGAGPVLPA